MAAVPIGLSFGDVVAAIKLCRDISRALSDHHGAVHAYKSTAEDVDGLVFVLEQVQHLRLGPGHAHYASAIRDRIDKVNQVLAQVNKHLTKHSEDIGKLHPKLGWHRDSVRKTRWVVITLPAIEKCRKELRDQTLMLQFLINSLNLKINTMVEATSSQAIRLLKTKADQDQHDFTDIKTMLEAIAKSTQELARDLSRSSVAMSPRASIISVQTPNCNNTENLNDYDDDWGDEGLQVDLLIACGDETSNQLREKLLVLAFFTMFYDAVNIMGVLALVAIPLLSLVPRSMSLLLPDNICIIDPLGRPFNRPMDYFKSWDHVELFLKFAFPHGAPGASKIERGQFRIFDIQDPDCSIDPLGWESVVGRRKKFKMSINMTILQMRDQCPKCRSALSPLGRTHNVCKRCGLLCHSPVKFISQSQLDKDAKMQASWKQHLDISSSHQQSSIGHTFCEKIRIALSKSMQPDSNGSTTNHPGASIGAEARAADSSHRKDEAQETHESASNTKIDSEATTSSEPVHDDVPEFSPQSSAERAMEKYEMKSFVSISAKRDESLHNAATKGDYNRVCELLNQGFDPRELGPTGPVLTAAVLSGSLRVARRLIKAGAEILPSSDIPVWYLPIPAAIRYSRAPSLTDYLLLHGARASEQKPRVYQASLDAALFDAISIGTSPRPRPKPDPALGWTPTELQTLQSLPSVVSILLYMGANPMSTDTRADRRSAFFLAYLRRQEEYIATFTASAWAYGHLSISQSMAIMQAFHRQKLSTPEGPNPSLEALYNNLLIEKTNTVEKEIERSLARGEPSREFFQSERFKTVFGFRTFIGPKEFNVNPHTMGEPREKVTATTQETDESFKRTDLCIPGFLITSSY